MQLTYFVYDEGTYVIVMIMMQTTLRIVLGTLMMTMITMTMMKVMMMTLDGRILCHLYVRMFRISLLLMFLACVEYGKP